MPRYIDGDQLLNLVKNSDETKYPIGHTTYRESVMLWIRGMPTVKERKTGRWETAMLDHEAFGVRPKVLYCSECHQCIAYPTRYCPNCGARMEVES